MPNRCIRYPIQYVAAAAVLVAAAVTIPTTPAAARTGPVEIIVISPTDTAPDKVAIARCPQSSPHVVGVSAGVLDGGRDVILTAMAPDADLGQVVARARDVTGSAGPWAVRAQALCDDGPAPVRVTAATGTGPAPARTVDAACPDGTRLRAAGFTVTGTAWLTRVEPHPDLSGLTVGAMVPANPTVGPNPDWGLTAIGVCGPVDVVPVPRAASGVSPVPGPHLAVLMVTVGPTVYYAPRSETVGPCPGSLKVSGVGAAASGDPTAFVSQMAINHALNTATATGNLIQCCFYVTLQVTVYGICG